MSGISILTSPYVLGIDFGTTNSSVAIYNKGEAIALKLSPTALTLPSVIWFPEKKNENVKIGREAKQKIMIKPDEVFSSIKMLMREGEAWKTDEAIKAKFEAIGGGELSPEIVATEILREIINQAQLQEGFDLNGEIEQVVICVPANTTDIYRKAIYDAAKNIGLGKKDDNGEVIILEDGKPKGVRLLEEPTAAALAYGLDQGFIAEGESKQQKILVYDLGGGTFDVTILDIDAGGQGIPKFSVVTTKGVARLGGDDFDLLIMEIIAEHFKEATEINVMDASADNNGISGKDIKAAQQKLKEIAEEAKIALSGGGKSYEVNIVDFLKDGDGNMQQLEFEVKKKDFLERIEPLLSQAQDCVKSALTDANLEIDDINRIILVGGSTKADWISDSVKELGKTPYVAENVDVMVSRGAAFYGASVLSGPILDDVTSHFMGIEVEGGRFSLVMEKDLELDAEAGVAVTKTFFNRDNQDNVWVTVYKTQDLEVSGEKGSKILSKDYYVSSKKEDGSKVFECIGEIHLKGIPKAPQGQEEIEVTLKTGEDKMLKVSALIKSTGEQADTAFDI
jgi:molecular chaperone DnaK